ncbi:DNA-binding protein HEXBP-like [Vigna radiata var. radiata]|uniref:DNA-binding protein HEXBP-like n=1 Tax=Vigna radiata var. radiata TaxID=3916 RepID=A0A1S3TAN7_VIGRR|nr:DNA-binding protein HEXBP-like [Vigna radiata var. radiata]
MRPQNGSFSGGRNQKKSYARPQKGGFGGLKCFECGGPHIRRNCPRLTVSDPKERKCYFCHKHGHFASSCPKKKIPGGAPKTQKFSGGKPVAAGRVFAMTGAKASG